jgi:6-phosphogluconolactonase
MDRIMSLHIYKDLDALSNGLAEWIADLIAKTLQTQDRFIIALSGGNTPKKMHGLLASSPYKEKIDWGKLHIFWGDERDVPFEDARNNAKMTFDTLLDLVDVPPAQIHPIQTDIPPEQSAIAYEKILHKYFGGSRDALPQKSFDLVLLGMGDDGHTLSLFPGTAVIHEERAWVSSFFLKSQDMSRITLTKNIVNRSAHIAFLISGSEKAHALFEVLRGDPDPDLYPSQVIAPADGTLDFFVDEAAASKINS